MTAFTGEEHFIDSGLIKIFREIIRRGVQTIRAYDDKEAKYLAGGRNWATILDDPNLAYGYNSTSFHYKPTAQEIDQSFEVWDWLKWLEQVHGKRDFQRVMAWASGISVSLIAKRENCSEKTVMNRIDRSVAVIANKFAGGNLKVFVVDEPYRETDFAFVIEKPKFGGKPDKIKRVFVYSQGYFLNGKKWNDGRRKHGL